jgi:catechol 2,3-dioxygenase-like lactoylglutathione lyase family enzyme
MTQGIHHITAIASDGVECLRFYSTVLGLRLVKKTVNQDDVETYHLFFGDRLGHPGMDLTFFIFQPAMQGVRGNGLVTCISLSVPEGALDFWKERFDDLAVKHQAVTTRFGLKRLVFFDSDEQMLELVEVSADMLGESDIWTTKDVPEAYAIGQFHSATLGVVSRNMIEPILTSVFGYEHMSSEGAVHLYRIGSSRRACFLEVCEEPSAAFGFNAAGTVHHIAFRAKDSDEQLAMRAQVVGLGLYPTDVINRFYFRSVYFRTLAGILFEIATDGPGFTADEAESELGKHLALPPFLEPTRVMIESNLVPLSTE